MKTVKHEIKLERSVKIILGVLALGIFLNAFATPISKEVFGIKEAIWIQVLVLLAAQPTGVNPFLFASRYNVGQLIASGSVFISTVFSIFTLSLLLAFFN